MCKCNPSLRTPFCGKGDCIPPSTKVKHEDLFVIFDGEETEKAFLKKCLEQWDKTENAKTETQKLLMLGGMFSEIRHRINELED